VLFAKADFSQMWRQDYFGSSIVITYQHKNTYSGYTSIGEKLVLGAITDPNQTYTWSVTDSSTLAYVQTGLQNTDNDLWFLEFPGIISVRQESCVTGTSTECTYGPFTPDLSVNSKADLSKVSLERIEVKLNAVRNGTRTGSLLFYKDEVANVPEPSSISLLALSSLGILAMRRRKHVGK
jgi:hypothetical protein